MLSRTGATAPPFRIPSMPLRALTHADCLLHQRSGPADGVPVLYLPGVHGCWTPLERARPLFSPATQLVEAAYPLFDHWSLARYADALEHLLERLGLDSVHLVGESFGSLVAWQFGLTRARRVRSHFLVGGFCQAPRLRVAASAGMGLSVVWSPAFDAIVDGYTLWKGMRGEAREAAPGVKAYPAVRGARGQRATANRMRLVQAADFRRHLHDVRYPVRYLGGAADRVVPVGREVATLERLLPPDAGFQSELLARAPHAIIASHPAETVARIERWVEALERPDDLAISRPPPPDDATLAPASAGTRLQNGLGS